MAEEAEKTKNMEKKTKKQPTQKKPSEQKVKRRKAREIKAVIKRGTRKTAVARAVVREGKGRIRINKLDINAIDNKYIKEILMEPFALIGERATKVDVDVSVRGGGVMGQMQAARTAIAKGLVEYFEDEKLREKYFELDKHLVVDDVRQVEPKKYKGPKARARYQKSYR
ncbi:MAG: 30S ribosomal protein S9 [Candidatus Anstonellales archaeon]